MVFLEKLNFWEIRLHIFQNTLKLKKIKDSLVLGMKKEFCLMSMVSIYFIFESK